MNLRFISAVAFLGMVVSSAVAQAAADSSQASSKPEDRGAALATAFARAGHLKRGINASIWFAQHPSDYSASYTDKEITEDDIALMAKLGFDNVRLSIDAVPLEQVPLGRARIECRLPGPAGRAVDAMLANGMAVQIDLHPEDRLQTAVAHQRRCRGRLSMLWRRLAAHYATRDPERVFFEIMNEPEVNDPYRWAGIQARVAAAIREVAPRNTIIATGPITPILRILLAHASAQRWQRDLYNFHFYNPHRVYPPGRELGSAMVDLLPTAFLTRQRRARCRRF